MYVAQWALKKGDLNHDNPPVYCSMDEKNFNLECENLYDFLCAMAGLQAASWGLPYCTEEIYYLNEERLSRIAEHYQKKPYELHEWIDITFYGNEDDEIICVTGGEQTLYGASSQVHFEEIEKFTEQLDLEVL